MSSETVSDERLKLWFFRDLSSEQRLGLFRLMEMPVHEIGQTHGHQQIALNHVLQSLRSKPVASGAERLGRFNHHPDPAIDFEIEVQSLQARFFDAKGGISKPGTEPEHVAVVFSDIMRAMLFVVGGDPSAVAAKGVLRELKTEAEQALSALLPKATAPVVSEPVAWVGDYRKSDGTTDYFVMLGKGGREMSLHMHRILGRAEYEAAEINHVLTGSSKPEFEDFDVDGPASPQPQPKAVTEEMVARAWLDAQKWPTPISRSMVRRALEVAMKEA